MTNMCYHKISESKKECIAKLKKTRRVVVFWFFVCYLIKASIAIITIAMTFMKECIDSPPFCLKSMYDKKAKSL